MKTRLRLLLLGFLCGGIFVLEPAFAGRGIYCTSYEYVRRDSQMSCLISCVVCFDLDNDLEIRGEDCQERSCWFRQV